MTQNQRVKIEKKSYPHNMCARSVLLSTFLSRLFAIRIIFARFRQ